MNKFLEIQIIMKALKKTYGAVESGSFREGGLFRKVTFGGLFRKVTFRRKSLFRKVTFVSYDLMDENNPTWHKSRGKHL